MNWLNRGLGNRNPGSPGNDGMILPGAKVKSPGGNRNGAGKPGHYFILKKIFKPVTLATCHRTYCRLAYGLAYFLNA
jgi:hypothetical protein